MQQVLASAPRSLHPLPAALPVENSFCEKLVLRVQAIWNALCAFIAEWACYLLSFVQSNVSRKEFIANPISKCSPDLLHAIARYLEPEDLGRLERVSPAVKASIQSQEERLWKSQCDLNGVSYTPQSGRCKDAFKYPYPEMAFGPREWIRYFGDPGEDLPRLPSAIHRILAKHPEIKERYVLTFCPAKLDGRSFCLNRFRERLLAPREGTPVQFRNEHWPQIFKKYGEEPAGKARWLFMEQNMPEKTKGITALAISAWKMNCRIGRTLEVAVSVVGALFYPKTRYLLGPHPGIGGIPDNWVFTRTADALDVHKGEINKYGKVVEEDESGTVMVGGLQLSDYDPAKIHYSLSFLFASDWHNGQVMSHRDCGIAQCFPVAQESLNYLLAAL